MWWAKRAGAGLAAAAGEGAKKPNPAACAADAKPCTLILPEVESVPNSAIVGLLTPLSASDFFSNRKFVLGTTFGFSETRQP